MGGRPGNEACGAYAKCCVIHFPLQFITAVLPAGPNGESQYMSLPADPRVMSGQYSYAMLQQPDGSQSIVLVENTNNAGTHIITYSGAPFIMATSGEENFCLRRKVSLSQGYIFTPNKGYI